MRLSRGWHRSTDFLVTGLGAAGGVLAVGLMVSRGPIVAIALLSGVVVVTAPAMGALAGLAVDGVGWPALVFGAPFDIITLGGHVVVGLCVVLLLLRGRRPGRFAVEFAAFALCATLPALLTGIFLVPSAQVIAGLRLLIVPVLFVLIGALMRGKEAILIQRALVILMLASLALSIYQTAVGAEALLATGSLQEGVNVRGIDGSLRATGTFLTNYHLGAFSGVMAIMCIFGWHKRPDVAAQDLAWRSLGAVASIACLALSTYRTGVVVVVVATAAMLLWEGRKLPRPLRAIALAAAAMLIAWFALTGLASGDSLLGRGVVWRKVLSRGVSLLGHGLGSSGAASSASGASRLVTDNYFLSLFYQMGVFGVLIVLILLWAVRSLVVEPRNRLSRPAAALLLGSIAGFFFVDFWEYTSAICLVMFAVGLGSQLPDRPSDGSPEPAGRAFVAPAQS